MSSRFATERVVLAQDDLVIPRSGSGLAAHEWRMARSSDGLYRDHVAGEHVTAPARSESQAAVAHRTGVRGRQGRAWAGSLRGPLLPRLNHHVSMVLVCFALSSRALQAFPPSAGKTATRKASHRHDGADGNPPERHFRDSFITVRLAVARVLATWLPRCPLCHRPRSMDAWCTCP